MFANSPRINPSEALVERHLPVLRANDLTALGNQAASGYRLLTPGNPDPRTTLMTGHFSIARMREGFHLHCTDVTHRQDIRTQFLMEGESIKVLLKLEGTASVRFGDIPLPLDAGQGGNARPRGMLVTLNQPERFERIGQAGTRERMVVLTLNRTWFEASGIDRDAFNEHLHIRQWQPSPRAIAIAEQLVRPASFDGPMHHLHQESRALELIAEALGSAEPVRPALPTGLHPSEFRRICRLQELLDSSQADSLDMAAIALLIGCNANTLQRHFRQVFGRSIFDYLRINRLQRAALALQRDGVSVSRAAEIAGYGSQANFSTAFRRHFGQPPKSYRTKL